MNDWLHYALTFLLLQVAAALGIGLLWPEEAANQPLLAVAKAAALAAIGTFVYWRVDKTEAKEV
ncbi:hypothetical protein [Ralstonia pickettii]|jgi:hypothetical protein|uniref:Transmembrane protein n=1 Tax=Ralstonia pickettii TaxID=329 RepID=A0AAW4Q8G8_RALPI|nr:hypothetical protein [Ralstonia pickettii]MBA9846581.1 hypothetical protein [Ralstonia pickettii]MBA9851924.1 hypothetical protein [Ralstonia pickettii]MBA9919719.1 hypothetical protein [Ralstonia pickettii]MBA9958877.1 hypothetical protein [Ralstonia pickettii]MBA9965066.1 hypothetical protein [Ralstonia pickettii]